MKKIITLFTLLMLAFTTTFAGVKIDSSAVTKKEVKTEVKVDSALYSDGKDFLKSVKVGTSDALSNGYDVVVAQQLVYAVQYLLIGILCVIFMFLFFRYYSKVSKSESNALLPAIICLVGTIWTAVVFSTHYGQVVQGFLNPDYAAIQDIINMTKNLMSK